MRRLAIIIPAVARRSPAMTTPVALRIATIVVPCGMSAVIGCCTLAPGSWCGATWRRRSANDGPGSVLGANSGNAVGSDIGRGAYRRVLCGQCLNACEQSERRLD